MFELSASPSLGSGVQDDTASTLIDDSEYEASFRAWTPLGGANGLRAQVKAGVTYSPNYFDDDDQKSGIYGEIQLGDTFVRLRNVVHGDFSEVSGISNAIRPYARYRYTNLRQSFLAANIRDDQQGTIGLRYRHVPFVMMAAPKTRGLHFEVRAELNRILSSDIAEELWNPKTQLDVISKPMWQSFRLVARATFEGQLYDHQDAKSGIRRADWRMRLTGGFDISDFISKSLDSNALVVELLARFQKRWSNDKDARHTRAYLVPSILITAPLG